MSSLGMHLVSKSKLLSHKYHASHFLPKCFHSVMRVVKFPSGSCRIHKRVRVKCKRQEARSCEQREPRSYKEARLGAAWHAARSKGPSEERTKRVRVHRPSSYPSYWPLRPHLLLELVARGLARMHTGFYNIDF